MANEVIATASAAGLKMCLLRSATTYFDDIARIAAQPRSWRSPGARAGSRIRARINAVMKEDSTLAGTSSRRARTVFAPQHMTSRKAAERSSAGAVKGSRPKSASSAATPT